MGKRDREKEKINKREKKLQARQFSQNCLSDKSPGSKKFFSNKFNF